MRVKRYFEMRMTGGVGVLNRRQYGAAVFVAAATVSAMAHGLAISWLLPPLSGDLGSVDFATNAISVNLETSDVLDAIENAASRHAPSSPAGIPMEGVTEAKEKQEEKEKQASTPSRSEDALTDTQEQQVTEDETEKKKREKAMQAAAPGGAGTAGADETQDSAGRISASQGAILNYGAKLRAMISSHTPRNIRKTSVRLGFSVAPSGGLMGASILASSGDPGVDSRILELVRELAPRFPQPPEGASASQLTYNIEIIFR